ncbi:hypothetical protein [Terribacillus saccharophilus]|uniref:hypothetical protein n=1 Tax=Terribacillus saccharophilus TaxID=361277 RepID=UPI002DCDE555|nr:hypothetical protein [Terribacillus saccharophilus]
MNNRKVSKVFSFIFGGITLAIVIFTIVIILFGAEIKILLWDAFTDDEPQAFLYDSF